MNLPHSERRKSSSGSSNDPRAAFGFSLDSSLDVVSYNLSEHPEDKIIAVKNNRRSF